jgi:hypothetical protein
METVSSIRISGCCHRAMEVAKQRQEYCVGPESEALVMCTMQPVGVVNLLQGWSACSPHARGSLSH